MIKGGLLTHYRIQQKSRIIVDPDGTLTYKEGDSNALVQEQQEGWHTVQKKQAKSVPEKNAAKHSFAKLTAMASAEKPGNPVRNLPYTKAMPLTLIRW